MMCMTELHGGVCHRTSTPHKSWNKMKEKKMLQRRSRTNGGGERRRGGRQTKGGVVYGGREAEGARKGRKGRTEARPSGPCSSKVITATLHFNSSLTCVILFLLLFI